ncbi:DUF4365 domain-containing protein [Stenotrophomonas sp.]|uniref:DUF4365 domain-containing protein n=1 Tax=Stenotrophomonas sp. TaxID=69392 RepID=UPI0028A21A87|nr:DUF4365 domain-containing protein [Stenotrophomonas sp.]
MDDKKQMEEFQYAYVAALAAHAGLNRGDFRVDDDSLDVAFTASSKVPVSGPFKSPQIQFQLKCTRKADIASGSLSFKLKVKNYRDLSARTLAPRYLVIMVVPANTDDWITYAPGTIGLQKECYWVSLAGKPPTSSTSKVTVKIPVANRLTTLTFKRMIDAASHGTAI